MLNPIYMIPNYGLFEFLFAYQTRSLPSICINLSSLSPNKHFDNCFVSDLHFFE